MAQSAALEGFFTQQVAWFNKGLANQLNPTLDSHVTVNNYNNRVYTPKPAVEAYFKHEYAKNACFKPTIDDSDAPAAPVNGDTGSVSGSASWTSTSAPSGEYFDFSFNYVYYNGGWLLT